MIFATTQLLDTLLVAFVLWLDNDVIKTLFGMVFLIGIVKIVKTLLQ